MSNTEIFSASGRRKTSIANVNIKAGSGKYTINGKSFDDYFATAGQRIIAVKPLADTENQKKFDVQIRAKGGGLNGQAGAASLAIARALIQVDSELRSGLKAKGFLRRDARMKERKKSGQPGARKRFQFSKR